MRMHIRIHIHIHIHTYVHHGQGLKHAMAVASFKFLDAKGDGQLDMQEVVGALAKVHAHAHVHVHVHVRLHVQARCVRGWFVLTHPTRITRIRLASRAFVLHSARPHASRPSHFCLECSAPSLFAGA